MLTFVTPGIFENSAIRLPGAGQIQRSRAIVCLLDLKALPLEVALDQSGEVRLVVHYQNLRCHPALYLPFR